MLTFKKPAVLLQGGPRDGWAYFADEIENVVRWNRLPYVETEEFVVHPRTGGKIYSRVWRYAPDIAPTVPAEPPAPDPWDFA